MIALYGGTFDPFHLGHEHVVRFVLKSLNPDELWLIPAHSNPLKTGALASAETRFQMAEIAAHEIDPRVTASRIEIDRPAPSYTIETVREISKLHRDITVVLGSDSAERFGAWRSPNEILTLANLMIVQRGPFSLTDFARRQGLPAPISGRIKSGSQKGITAVDIQPLDISATRLRAEIKDYWLSPHKEYETRSIRRSVWLFIKANRIYADGLHR